MGGSAQAAAVFCGELQPRSTDVDHPGRSLHGKMADSSKSSQEGELSSQSLDSGLQVVAKLWRKLFDRVGDERGECSGGRQKRRRRQPDRSAENAAAEALSCQRKPSLELRGATGRLRGPGASMPDDALEGRERESDVVPLDRRAGAAGGVLEPRVEQVPRLLDILVGLGLEQRDESLCELGSQAEKERRHERWEGREEPKGVGFEGEPGRVVGEARLRRFIEESAEVRKRIRGEDDGRAPYELALVRRAHGGVHPKGFVPESVELLLGGGVEELMDEEVEVLGHGLVHEGDARGSRGFKDSAEPRGGGAKGLVVHGGISGSSGTQRIRSP